MGLREAPNVGAASTARTEGRDHDGRSPKGMAWRAKAYIGATLALGAGALVESLARQPETSEQVLAFVALTLCAAVSHLFPVVTPRNQAYYISLVFMFAAVLLVPPGGVGLLILLALLPEWLRMRYAWYVHLFNMANLIINAWVARGVLALLGAEQSELAGLHGLAIAAIAAVVFTFANHVLLATVLNLTRGHSLRKTGLFERDNLLTDITLAGVGIILAIIWQVNPLLSIVVLAPLFLIHRALHTPTLREQASTDPKTGLYNARHFARVLHEEVQRAGRFDRHVSVIMADLDMLRNINNAYGHLAGDAVLRGVATAIKSSLREYDVAARFGGEEFTILLPETDGQQALVVAERIRERIEAGSFTVSTSVEPIKATVSIGVASFPDDALKPEDIIHEADMAVYCAKLQGRNRCLGCSDQSRALGAGMRISADAIAAFAKSGDLAGTRYSAGSMAMATASANWGAASKIGALARQPVMGVEVGDSGGVLPLLAIADGQSDGRPSEPQRANRRERATDLSLPVLVLIGGVIAATVALWWLYRPWETAFDWLGLSTLAALTVASQGMAVETYGRGKISVGGIFVLAGGFIFGMEGVLVLALVLSLSTWVLRRGLLHRTLFDAGNTSLWGAAAVIIYDSVSSRVPWTELVAFAVPAVLAAAAYYVVNVGLLSAVFALVEKQHPVAIWNEKFRWMLPHYLAYGLLALVVTFAYRAIGIYGLLSFLIPPLMLRYAMKQYLDRTEANVAEVKRVNRRLVQAHDEVVSTLGELRETYSATLTALSTALDTRDTETEGHSRRVVRFAEAIGHEYELSEAELQGLLTGAMLHDIGKIGVPDAILRKPAALTAEEWAVMKTHPEQGSHMIAHIAFLRDAIPVVRHHHERYDGRGYPDALRGEEIPISARIFAVADAFDAMISDRPYRRACSVEAARAEIQRCSGTQFDPQVVEAFLRLPLEDLVESANNPAPADQASGDSSPKAPLRLVVSAA